jgi:hypothetical protein
MRTIPADRVQAVLHGYARVDGGRPPELRGGPEVTRDEVLERLASSRAVFAQKLALVPRAALEVPVPGSTHSVKDIVFHVSAYDDLVVLRLIAARAGITTQFDRDRDGYEVFNERVWGEAAVIEPDDALARADEVFTALVHEVGRLTDGELEAATGATAALDPAWLQGQAPWEPLAMDCWDHYPMHYAALDAAKGL